jgi:hypothetical protein
VGAVVDRERVVCDDVEAAGDPGLVGGALNCGRVEVVLEEGLGGRGGQREVALLEGGEGQRNGLAR